MPIDPKFYVNLKGRLYPLYAGVLDCATNSGLRSLTTQLVQIPAEENGNVAVVKARVEMEDGRVFEDYGDCSPRNTSPAIATAAIRMASTRAKGRALRDAINLGETLREEMPDSEVEEGGGGSGSSGAHGTSAPPAASNGGKAPEPHERKCRAEGCRKFLTAQQWSKAAEAGLPPFCTEHQAAATGPG